MSEVVIKMFISVTEKDSSLQADYEIQAWGAEIVKSVDDGGAGIKVCNLFIISYSIDTNFSYKNVFIQNINVLFCC